MAKFCKFCGSPLEEGQLCGCPGAQAERAAAQPQPEQSEQPVQAQPEQPAPAASPVATAAPAASATADKAKSLFTEWKDIFLAYLRAPQNGVAKAADSKNGLIHAGLFAAVNALVVFFFLWRLLAATIGSFMIKVGGTLSGIGGMIGGSVSVSMDMSYPIFQLLLSGILCAVLFIGLSGLMLFVLGKICKKELNIQKSITIAGVSSIYPTLLLAAGLLLGFISVYFQILVLVIAAIIWAVNACADLHTYLQINATDSLKNMAIVVGLMTVVAAICGYLTIQMMGWCIGGIEVEGVKVSDAIGQMSGMGGILDILG